MNKKKLFAIALVVLMIAITSFSSLAWFNGKDTVDNKFQIADSDNDGLADFAIDVKEKQTDEDGNLIFDANNEQVWTDEGNTYEDIMPGDQLNKYAVVKNTGAYDEWVRVNITITDAEVWTKAIKKAIGNDAATDLEIQAYIVTEMLAGFDANLYEQTIILTRDTTADTMMITAYLDDVLESGEEFVVMESFSIPGVLEQKDMVFGIGADASFTVSVRAEAVQVDNLGANSASEAFTLARWEIGTNYGE